MDVERQNAEWLAAWSDKDVERLLSFYSQDVVYRDPQVPKGLVGRAALRSYLVQLFDSTPPMRYEPDAVWETKSGWCGRWVCALPQPDGPTVWLRGFDLVVLAGPEIAINEVYTHTVDADPRTLSG